MKAVAIKKGQSREKSVGFREMGAYVVTVVARNFSLVMIRHSQIRGLPKNRRVGSKRSWPKSMSATRNTRTESNCRSDQQEFD